MSEARRIARAVLSGVGDAELGEWDDQGSAGDVHHVRRRLSSAEQLEFGIPAVRDIRGTLEEQERFRALLEDAPYLRWLFA